MPWEGKVAMDEAGARAKLDLDSVWNQMPAEHHEALRWLAGWWRDHYRTAGHKRLGRIVLNLDVDDADD